MQINDLMSQMGISKIDVNTALNSIATNALNSDEAVQFSEILDEYMNNAEDVSKAASLTNNNKTDYHAIAEDLMSSSSGREVIYRIMENQLASIATDNYDADEASHLNNILTSGDGIELK